MISRAPIDDFLAQKRLAVVGVSRNPQDFTRILFDELRTRGYDLVPVNASASEIAGLRCYAHVQDISPPVDGALLFTPPAVTEQVVRECAAAGIKRIWMHRGAGTGAVSPEAVAFCNANGMTVVPGFCPYMFLPKSGCVHRAHGFFMKLAGKYPT